MRVTTAVLSALNTTLSAAYQGGLEMSDSQYLRVATEIASSNKSNTYGWLGKMPNVREWIGDRVIQNLKSHSYQIFNKDWELTLGVDRNDIEDDDLGQYAPLFQEMGMSTQSKSDLLTFGLLAEGFTTDCYDGQPFFDTDHPVLDKEGVEQPVSNMTAGASTPWFLMSTKRPLKPLIYQNRKPWQFVAKDALTDDNVFHKKEFIYGSDARANVGFGLWQLAHGSKATLNAANYEIARVAMSGMLGDHGRPLGIKPDLLVVPPSLEGAANKIVTNLLAAGGETNEWAGTAEVLVVPWLAAA
ncbi:MAG: hypothetical protein GQ535_12280 [Rhodobacteraceae bacterium]|nr:hypothetical protein [Paracoccaceae bacterium]